MPNYNCIKTESFPFDELNMILNCCISQNSKASVNVFRYVFLNPMSESANKQSEKAFSFIFSSETLREQSGHYTSASPPHSAQVARMDGITLSVDVSCAGRC
ncbi:hypothetical protein CEXT_302871 [Caerostris extrusa]|uniref:Uncharacterized protein n=1 Tax=Caerostris extrusa TaxID=172846 RepID=A0AAV4V4A8_CAEEX|nr:hypothetical protein CEXT_302871 [Caerostris extrusa]